MNTIYYFIPFIIFIILIVFIPTSNQECFKKNYEQVSDNRGQITTIEYKGHSYTGWTCNMGCSLTHDPDCKCKK